MCIPELSSAKPFDFSDVSANPETESALHKINQANIFAFLRDKAIDFTMKISVFNVRLSLSQIAGQSPSAREMFCNLPRGVIGAVCETHHWAKAVGGGESEKVESWNRRFKVARQNRSVLETSDTRQDILA